MRKTKIVCTIGPATDDKNIMRELMLAGMNVARFRRKAVEMESSLNPEATSYPRR